jgi:hypothetical protein
MPVFRSPGLADSDAPEAVLTAWNKTIVREIQGRPASPILVADPATIANGATSSGVKWPGHPLEPFNCESEEVAAALSDWGWAGRAELHNEYLEYALVMRTDAAGASRPKRFIATTELMEWWQTMAVYAPDYFLDRVASIAGARPSMTELFGVTTEKWLQQSEATRRNAFHNVMVGNGRNPPPVSGLNQQHALFMAHQINGLDDLIYVVHFGSFSYAVKQGGVRRRATIEEIFYAENVKHLFCRNADPAAAEGAYNQAFLKGTENNPQARKLAFADPLGMYIRTFSPGDLYLNGAAVPASWTRCSRGDQNGMPQRLEFGPADSDAHFLDDVTIGTGADAPRVDGYQLAKRIEVGPLVVVGQHEAVNSFKDIPAIAAGAIACGSESDSRCAAIAAFKAEYDAQRSLVRGTRGGRQG